ncbi:MAG: Transcriptional regulator MraZ [Alphaproteobacteria bacterium MarineAlpha5_Bin6]|nr:MAG: Transcriptional regulator MraZ [Alphaproteobacteria bacterium MarineAlpha5_Bin7]PPR52848.1 MAG: Transcriptional regulator MraZ [Alphaproteobacteria bacterium MarineAlpha5_Bin6]|tara:strand:+ start:698 stop:1171 length:474 start_codon:yes stop_codon:yes gene_type:complete
MDLFLSKFSNNIDKKGRVTLPSLFRNALPKNDRNEIILFKSLKFSAIEGCSSQRINNIAKKINELDIFSDDQEDFATSIFSEVIPTKLDKEGRFLIPDNLKNHANILNEATFIGQGHYFQIWNPKGALERQQKSRERLVKEKRTLGSILSKQENKND